MILLIEDRKKIQELNQKKRGEKIFTDELGSYGIEKSETNSEVSGLTAALAGVASGIIKIPEGVVSLGAELIDLGAGTSLARNVETFLIKLILLKRLHNRELLEN